MKGSGIISAYHTRRVAPLMSHALPLYLMVPGASLDGTALIDGALPPPKSLDGTAHQGGDGAFLGQRGHPP